MQTFNSKFAAELKKGKSNPVSLVHLQESIHFEEKTLQADWAANSAENNVDYTPSPPNIGEVILATDIIPDEENLSGNTWGILSKMSSPGESIVPVEVNENWQSFKQNTGIKEISLVKGYFKADIALFDIKCSVWNAGKTSQISTVLTLAVTSSTGEWLSFDFSSQDISIDHDTEYWIKFESIYTGGTWPAGFRISYQYYQNTDVYTKGQFDRTGDSPGTDLGDLTFELTFTGNYYFASGFLTTDNIDLGSVPTVNGEWIFSDAIPVGTSLIYEAWSSATGVFDIWNEYDPGPVARSNAAYCISGSKMYIFGGLGTPGTARYNDLWSYDFTTRVWEQLTSGATIREGATLSAYNNKLYLYGGYNGTSYLDDIYEYDISGDNWTPKTSGATIRGLHSAVLDSGKIYIFGGYNGTTWLNTIYEYNISGDSWTPKTSGATIRGLHSAVLDSGKMYIFGGFNGTARINTIYEYNISGDSWIAKTSGATIRSAHSAVSYNGKMYIHGGNDGGSGYLDSWEYNFSGDSWTQETSSPTGSGRYGASSVLYGDSMFIYGGFAAPGSWIDTFWSYGTLGGDAVSLGIVVDGNAIIDLKRYYRVRAILTANTNRDSSPILSSIVADFAEYLKIYNSIGLTALTTTIDLFEESTISQMTVTLALTAATSNWMAIKKPRNKRVKIFIGFNAAGFTEDDFEKFYFGTVANADITSDDKIKIAVEGLVKDWKEDVPSLWEDAGDNVTWTNVHPIDVMLDIYRTYLPVRDSALLLDSFYDVKAQIPDWIVTRTITDDPIEGKKLLEELRKLMSCFFIPQPDGSVKIKRWDPNEASVASITDLQLMSKNYKGNYRKIINRLYIYFDWSGSGDDAGDFNALLPETRPDSKADYGKWETETIKDKWTQSAELSQVEDMAEKLLDRYEDPPPLLPVTVDLKNLAIEEGDIIEVTTKRAPSIDMTGISAKRVQIVKKQINWQKKALSWELLAVEG